MLVPVLCVYQCQLKLWSNYNICVRCKVILYSHRQKKFHDTVEEHVGFQWCRAGIVEDLRDTAHARKLLVKSHDFLECNRVREQIVNLSYVDRRRIVLNGQKAPKKFERELHRVLL